MNRFQTIIDLREAIGGDRFIMTMGAGIANTILFAFGVLSESGYVTLTMATVATFIAGEALPRMVNRSAPNA